MISLGIHHENSCNVCFLLMYETCRLFECSGKQSVLICYCWINSLSPEEGKGGVSVSFFIDSLENSLPLSSCAEVFFV